MPTKPNSKQYDLENRTLQFAKDCRVFTKQLSSTMENLEDGPQLIRASGSVGANYIEANEAVSKKDFRHKIKIAKKEAKEARYWLQLMDIREEPELENKRKRLIQEATELMKILGSILENSLKGGGRRSL